MGALSAHVLGFGRPKPSLSRGLSLPGRFI